MKQKCLAILCLTFAGASGSYAQITLNSVASRAVGQPQLVPKTSAPNYVEGRELWEPQGIALDASVTPPVLYVADSNNNRVMVWKNATGFSNGQPADLIIGQIDQYSTTPGGGAINANGLSFPTGLAVQNGNLYVADTGNNRILRFPKPYTQTTGSIFPDMWIGQQTNAGSARNYSGLTATALNLAGYQVGLAFDSNGGLWASDPGNNRLLHYPASALSCTNCGAVAADSVLGQSNFTTTAQALSTSDAAAALIANEFNVPGPVAIDSAGNLYVGDAGSGGLPGRILIFQPPFNTGASAARIMGIPPASTSQTGASQTAQDATIFKAPNGIFFYPGDGAIGVLDTGFNRILTFPPYASWKGTTTPTSPQAIGYYGQATYLNTGPNGAALSSVVTPQSSSSAVWAPAAAVVNTASKELYLADALNNRVLAMPLVTDGVSPATRVLGQDLMNSNSPNLIEGREFDFVTASSNGGAIADAGIAIDTTGPTPHLYVADPYNNRILGFKDLRTVQPGARADLVIGQPNFTTALCNYNAAAPNNGGDITLPTASSLCLPKGLAVDSQGNLYVADSGNGRVLRFPAPFSNSGPLEPADLVLGQTGFNVQFNTPGATTMASPYGLAFTGTNGLLVSDEGFNRVLYFKYPSGTTFRAGTDNGIAATKVFGQASFNSVASGSSAANMNAPHHIASDTNGQLYVADSGNNRVLVFQDPNNPQTPSSGFAAGTTLPGFSGPQGIYVNPSTGEIWVANTNQSTAQRYPAYATLLFNPTQLGKTIQDYSETLALAQDTFGDLVIADAASRISIYFPQMDGLNGANFEVAKEQVLAPQMIASLFPADSTVTFGQHHCGSNAYCTYTDVGSSGVWPSTLDDTQVLFNGTPAPIDFVSSGQINFLVPNGAPVTGIVDVEVVQKSTSQVYAAGEMAMTTVNPGLFLCPGGQTGNLRTACILNQDNTVNTQTNAASTDTVIQIYATGLGNVPNAPADGQPAAGAISGSASLDIIFSATATGSAPRDPGDPPAGQPFVQYVGLAPGYVGLWQINVIVPSSVAPSNQTPIYLFVNGNVGEPDRNAGYQATVAIKH